MQYKPFSEFCELEAGLSLDDVLPHCAKCRTDGVPKPKFLNLTRRHRLAMQAILAAPTFAAGVKRASELTGFDPKHIHHLIAGRRVPEFRQLFQLELEAAGADMAKVIKVQVEALDAEEHKYNPAAEEFVSFPDHRTRLRAAQHVQKTLELDPPKADGVNVGVQINFKTNLGEGETFDPPGTMRARPKGPIVDVSNET